MTKPSIDAQQVPAAVAAATLSMRRALELLEARAVKRPELLRALEAAHSDAGLLLAFLRRSER